MMRNGQLGYNNKRGAGGMHAIYINESCGVLNRLVSVINSATMEWLILRDYVHVRACRGLQY